MTAPGHRIGCADLPPGMSRQRYFERLSFLESSVLATTSPSLKSLEKWKTERPAGTGLALVVPHTIDLGFLTEAVRAAGAEVALFRTPADLSPSASHRDEVRALLGERTAELGAVRVWEPQGLWSLAAAAALAREAGALLALDPLAADPLSEDRPVVERELERGEAYLRLRNVGSGRRRFRDTHLDDLAEQVTALERSWTAFANVDKLRDARAFVTRLDV